MEDKHERGDDANSGEHPPKAPIIPKGGAPNSQKCDTERDAQTNKAGDLDRELVRWTRWLAFFTAALVFAAILQFWELEATRQSSDRSTSDQMAVMRDQAKAMQGQLDQMAAAQRPWVQITSVDILNVEIVKDWILVWADVGIRNVGHSPAIDLHIRPVLRSDISLTEEPAVVQSACSEAKSDAFSAYQTVLFPGEQRTIHPNESLFSVPVASIEADNKGRAWSEYIRAKEFFGSEKALGNASQTLSHSLKSGMSLIGCVAYKAPGSNVAHATSFGRYLNRSCQPSPTGMCSFDFSVATVLDKSLIESRDFLSASYAD